MELTRKQFHILSAFADPALSLLKSKKTGIVDRDMEELRDAGFLASGHITPAGLEALEPYRVRRAVFLAAGFGRRMMPVTLNTPKPLVRVHGKRLIDRLIDACLDIGIEEIYIVRGYLAEQFDQLLYQYPMIKFLENPLYDQANNISSALAARNLLENAYVFEADLLIHTPRIIEKYQYTSNFLAISTEHTEDWCFEVRDGVIVKEKLGGENCWQMVGVSFWNETDGQKLARDIPEVYAAPGGKELYWEQVPLEKRKERYAVEVRQCRRGDIVEIDTFQELKELDPQYDA